MSLKPPIILVIINEFSETPMRSKFNS
jgi:hypothetical protein